MGLLVIVIMMVIKEMLTVIIIVIIGIVAIGLRQSCSVSVCRAASARCGVQDHLLFRV